MGGEAGPVTTTSSTPVQSGAEKSTHSWRSGVTVRFAAAMSPRPCRSAFLPGLHGAVLLALLLVVLGFGFWRSATNLQGHVKAGAEMIVEVLGKQARGASGPDDRALAQVGQLLPGLGEPVPFRVDARSVAAGKTLAELDLRGLTGATVLAIIRDERGTIVPTAREELRAGDVLALAGTHTAVEAAKSLLQEREPARSEDP